MPEGVIIGGWNYVIAAYSITTVALIVYVWSLRSRSVKERQLGDRPEEDR